VMPVRAKKWVVPATLAIIGLAALLWQRQEPSSVALANQPVASSVAAGGPPSSATPAIAAAAAPAAPAIVREFVLRPRQTLGEAVALLGLAAEDAHAVTTQLTRFVDPRRLQPGATYRARLDPDARVAAVELTLDRKGEVIVRRVGNDAAAGAAVVPTSWNATFRPVEKRIEIRAVQGVVTEGFEAAVRAAGADGELAYRIADVLQWDIDFNRDLRSGDRFEVLFEEVSFDGARREIGDVIALAFTNGGRRVEAFRYQGQDYFDADGQPLQKMFLRSPMKYSRVTSRFSMRRFHPVLKVYRPHYGIDYGAPSGTPAYVTAAGVVTFMGWDGGGGRTVKVRHPNGYVTNYLHLSRFPSGVRVGSRVKQSEVIGYVGATGLATAPHLDYRVQWNGRWIDPLKIANVRAEALKRADLPAYQAWTSTVRASLMRAEVPDFLQHAPSSSALTVLAAAPGVIGSASSVSTRR
jgi:murein DD-endopeptidase MepM/ murein hydrolase activator NlpD